MTARDLIKGSLRLIGAIASGETPSAAEEADALSVLNSMLSGWSTNGLLLYAVTRETFPILSTKTYYTIGSDVSADFNTVRPITIQNAGIESGSTTIELPVEIVNSDQWAEIGVKNLNSNLPTKLYFEQAVPLAKIYLWPKPISGVSLVIYSNKVIGSYANASDSLNLPDGYERALRYNLAVELAPEYGKEASGTVMAIAMESKADISRPNTQAVYASCDGTKSTTNRNARFLGGE